MLASAALRRKMVSFWRNQFVRSVAVVASGTAGAQAINLAFYPVITRIYDPQAFGVLGSFMAILAVAGPGAALAYPIAVVLPKRDEEALNVLRLSIYITLVIVALTLLSLWIGGRAIVDFLHFQVLGAAIYLLPPAMLAYSWVQITDQWLTRKKAFATIAFTSIAYSAIVNGAKIFAGFFMPSGLMLVTLSTLGLAIFAVFMSIGIYRKTTIVKSGAPAGLHDTSVAGVARRYIDFPLYRTPQLMISAASQGLPIIILAALYNPTSAGFYTLAKAAVGAPTNFLGKSISSVIYPRIAGAAHAGEDMCRILIMTTMGLLIIALPLFGLIVGFGPWIFGMVFGSEWIRAGEYARWLALLLMLNFISRPCVAAIPVLRIQRGLLLYEIATTSSKLAGFVLAIKFWNNDVWAVATFAIIGVLSYLIMNLWVINAARRSGDAHL